MDVRQRLRIHRRAFPVLEGDSHAQRLVFSGPSHDTTTSSVDFPVWKSSATGEPSLPVAPVREREI